MHAGHSCMHLQTQPDAFAHVLCSRSYISAAHTIVSYCCPRWAEGGNVSSWLPHQYLKRQVGQCGSWNLTCSCCQATSNSYNWASAISWPSRWTLISFVTSGKMADNQCVISTPTFREVIMVKIVRIIVNFYGKCIYNLQFWSRRAQCLLSACYCISAAIISQFQPISCCH